MSTWRDSLAPASWRGLAFSVIGSEATVGRRIHLHEYPFRDEPWAEDLGRRSRIISVKGFLIGDDVADQLAAFVEAAEQEGEGELVHPLRGTMNVTLLALGTTDAWDQGRVVRLAMEFLETGERRFPDSVADGPAEVAGAAAGLDAASAASAETGIVATLKGGIAGVKSVVKTVQGYVATARSLVAGATGIIRSVSGLAGTVGLGSSLGRFVGNLTRLPVLGAVGRALGGAGRILGSVTSVLSRFAAARSAVNRIGSTVMSLASRL